MTSIRRSATTTAVLWAVLLGGTALEAQQAQQTPARPFRRVFGQAPAAAGPERLNLDFTLSHSFDDNLLAGRLVGSDPRVGEQGTYPAAGGNLLYERDGRRISFSGSGSSNVQFYPSLNDRLDHNHNGSVNLGFTLSPRSSASVSQSAAYATYYTLAGLPGVIAPTGGVSTAPPAPPPPAGGLPLAVASDGVAEYHTFGSVERRMGRRNSFDSHYGFGLTRFSNRESKVHEAGLGFNNGLTENLSLRTGYGIEHGARLADGESVILHNIDVGVDFSRTLPGLRNTSMSVSTGSTVLQLPSGFQYNLSVNAGIFHQMGRSWRTSLTYVRGADISEVLGDVLQSDSLNADLSGFVSPRIELTFAGSYTAGHLGVRAEAETLTYNGSARVQYGLSRTLALTGEYLYYLYDFAEAAALPAGLPFAESRQSVRVGLLIRLPLKP